MLGAIFCNTETLPWPVPFDTAKCNVDLLGRTIWKADLKCSAVAKKARTAKFVAAKVQACDTK